MKSNKGKEVAGKGSSEKRLREDDDKTGRRKKRNRGVLQFFDDAAYEVDEDDRSEDSIFDDDFFEDEFWTEVKVKNESGKAPQVPVFPKEEELSEEELEKMLQERYKPGSSFVTYAEDGYDSKRSVERSAFVLSTRDPVIWKVKCTVGRERHSAFCLMQKYIDLQSLGAKLQIVSAFALDHVKGFIYIEADKQNDINEACKGICSVYSSRMASVPKNEVSHLMSIRGKYNEVSRGTWARVKNGRYKGDLAQVVAVNHARKNATVKLIPRIDFQVLAEKYGGGVKSKKTAIPAPRLICSTELEEFRPLIQSRRDRETGEFVEILDGMMLKDGYLFKKIALDSLNCWGVMPSEEELLKFEFTKKEESGDLEWLSQLYGEEKKEKCTAVKSDKGGGKGDGSSSSGVADSFDVHDLVFFRRKDFGVIVGTEKDHSFKILKEGSEGPIVVSVDHHELKNASFDKKLTALDQRKKTIMINDTVRVAGGPLEGKQGIVKKIYRGTVFLHDENEPENGGYFCSRSQMCEKIKLSDDGCYGKGGKSGPSDFQDFPSSPKSPLSPKKPWQPTENDNRNFNQGDKDGMFSVGQSLRIRVGPLKGYLCRVLAVRRSDVTVKLDSQQKVLTVKSEHLAEVKGKSSAIPIGEAAESVKPFDLLGTQDGSRDWADGVGTSADGERWGAGGLTTERSAWPAFPSSSLSLQPGSDPVQNEPKTDGAWGAKPASNKNSSWGNAVADENASSNSEQADGAWGAKPASNKNSSWGTAVANENAASNSEQADGAWGAKPAPKKNSSWGTSAADENPASNSEEADGAWGAKPASKKNSSWGTSVADENPASNSEPVGGWNKAIASGSSDNWGKPKISPGGDQTGPSKDAGGAWGKAKPAIETRGDSSWDKGQNIGGNSNSGWNNASAGKSQSPLDSWGKGKDGERGGSAWGKPVSLDQGSSEEIQVGSWGKAASTAAPENKTGSWGNTGRSSGPVEEEASGGWKKATGGSGGQNGNWGNAKKSGGTEQGTGGSTWGKAVETQDRDDTGSWGKAAEKGSTKDGSGGSKAVWGKAVETQDRDDTGTWGKAAEKGSTKDDSGGSKADWNSSTVATENQTGGWGNAGGSLDLQKSEARGWKKQDGGSSWGGKEGGGSWSKQSGGDDQNSSWGTPKSSGGGRGFGGWSSGGFGNNDDTEFDGGRGSGGRRGRGGGRGGRDQFGSGGSFGRGRSSGGWSKDGEDNYGAGGGNGAQSGGWGRGNNAFDGGKKDHGWSKPNASSDDNGWKSGTGGSGGGNWNTSKPKLSNEGQLSGWTNVPVNDEAVGVDDQKGGWNKRKAGDENQSTAWGTKTSDLSANPSSRSSWGTQKGSQDNSSGWNQKSADNEKDGANSDQQDGWKSRKTSDGGSATGWGQSSKSNSGAGDAGGNQSSGWGNKNSWGSGNSDAGGDQKSSWGNKGNWSSGNDFGGSENQTDSFGGRGRGRGGGNWRGGRGGSDRGGFGGRGDSDSGGRWSSEGGGFGGRGRSDRGGGFRGRGGSDRGGYGGRGRGRRDDFGDPKSYDSNKGSDYDNSGGWKSSGGGSWSQSGADEGQGQGRSSGWNPSKGANANEGARDQASGGWNKGSDTNNSNSGGWKSTGGGSWNQGGADKGQGQSWNSVKGAEGSGGSGDQAAGGWNKSSDNNGGGWKRTDADKAQGQSWNSSKSDGNAGGSDQAAGGWKKGSDSVKGNEAAGSWGKGNEGGSKGGW